MSNTDFPKLPELIDKVTDQICNDVAESNVATLRSVIQQNIQKGGALVGYTFGGRRYSELKPQVLHKIKGWETIHDDLYADALALHKSMLDQERDTQRLRQGLALPMRGSVNWQDVRDALPEMLAFLPMFSGLSRTRPEAFSIMHNDAWMQEYAETRELITYFLSARMFY